MRDMLVYQTNFNVSFFFTCPVNHLLVDCPVWLVIKFYREKRIKSEKYIQFSSI